MVNDIEERFYKLGIQYSRSKLTDPKYPVLSNEEGILGESTLHQWQLMALFFKENSDLPPPTMIFTGDPASGKTTTDKEYKEWMADQGFVLGSTFSYEEALAQASKEAGRSDDEKINARVWRRTNEILFINTIEPYFFSQKPVRTRGKYRPKFYTIEVPGRSLYAPGHRKWASSKNRDRGVSFLHELSKIIDLAPFYVAAITGSFNAQHQIVQHRADLVSLKENEEMVNAYLWAKELLEPEYKVNPLALIQRLKHMAMPKHWEKIRQEASIHKAQYTSVWSAENFKNLLEIREILTGEKLTEDGVLTLLEMLTFNYFLNAVGIPRNRIIDIYNPFRPELEKRFFQQFSQE